jgi:uncharacterized RDD family membrane protein YckC
MNTCSVCRTANNPGNRTCQLCGTALERSQPLTQSQPAAETQRAPVMRSAAQAHVYALEPVTHPRYANFLSRFFAAIVDGLIAGVIWAICFGLLYLCGFAVLFGSSLQESLFGGLTGAGLMLISAPVGLTALLLYVVRMETGPNEATLGKKLFSLRVLTVDGNRISTGQSLGRFFVKNLFSGLFLCIGYIMAAFTDRKQALHDLAAGTIVVQD